MPFTHCCLYVDAVKSLVCLDKIILVFSTHDYILVSGPKEFSSTSKTVRLETMASIS